MANTANELKIRSFQFSDSHSCRELFIQGMLEVLPTPIMRAVYPGFLRKALMLGLVAMAAAWYKTVWIAVVYCIVCVLLSALLYVLIYMESYKYINRCLTSDLSDIEKHYMKAEGSHMWVAEINEEVVGTVGLLQTVNHKLGTAELQRMSVLSSCRGKGIGKKLLNKVIHFARENGHKRIILSTTSVQSPAIRLYRSAGFKVFSSIRPHPSSPYILKDIALISFELHL